MGFLLSFVQFMLAAVWLLVLVRVLMSWVDPTGRMAVTGRVFSLTEPILDPVRRVLPRSGAIDWSSFVVLIVLGFLWRAF